jgi:hypothetical protein
MDIRSNKIRSIYFKQIHLVYLFLALIILAPILRIGYIQTLDMPWGPLPYTTKGGHSYSLLFTFLQYIGDIFTQAVTQKILLLWIFSLSGIGVHRLISRLPAMRKFKDAAYLAGILYTFNPFVYTRLMAGQWLVLLGYALLPWAVGSFWQLMERPGWRQTAIASSWTIAVGLTSIHAVGFVLLLHTMLFASKGRQQLRKRSVMVAAASAAWLVVNSIWLVPLLLGHSHTASQISSFGPSQLQAFKTRGTVAGSVPLSALLLEGFWADGQGRYYLPSHLGWWWYIAVALLGAIIVYGAAVVLWQRDRLGIVLLVAGLIAWWLGMGVGSSWSAGTTNFLVHYIPFYKGYREPQKWLMVLALLYSYLAAVGIAHIVPLMKRVPWRQPAIYCAMLLPILITPLLLWGASRQLVSAEYPSDWATAERTLDADHSNYQVLVLPWHEYLPISFAKRVVANPANHYFTQQLIISDNPELAGVPPAESTPLYRQIDNTLLPEANFRTDAAAQLAPYHVKYVLLLKEADWQNYGWIHKQTGFTLIQNSQTIQLYKLQ